MSAGPNLAAGMMVHSGAMVGMHFGVPTMEDIALALSRIPRFGGHCRTNWTVLDHVLVCERIALKDGAFRELRLACLLHDAHEALTGDCPSPLKVPQLKVLQRGMDDRIFDAYYRGDYTDYMNPQIQDAVHKIDYRALLAEAVTVGPPGLNFGNVVELFGAEPRREDLAVVRAQEEIAGWGFDDQIEYFLTLYAELTS